MYFPLQCSQCKYIKHIHRERWLISTRKGDLDSGRHWSARCVCMGPSLSPGVWTKKWMETKRGLSPNSLCSHHHLSQSCNDTPLPCPYLRVMKWSRYKGKKALKNTRQLVSQTCQKKLPETWNLGALTSREPPQAPCYPWKVPQVCNDGVIQVMVAVKGGMSLAA